MKGYIPFNRQEVEMILAKRGAVWLKLIPSVCAWTGPNTIRMITDLSDEGMCMNSLGRYSFQEVLEKWTFLDGTPFGKKSKSKKRKTNARLSSQKPNAPKKRNARSKAGKPNQDGSNVAHRQKLRKKNR